MRLPRGLCSILFGLALCLAPLGAAGDIVVAATSNLNGGPILKGVESAVESINEKGGLLGQKLRLVSFDGGCNERQSLDQANRVVKLEPALVVGLECSDGALAAAPVYAAHGIIQIAALSSNPRLTEKGISTLFRLVGRDDAQGVAAADLIATKWPHARIALISDETVYGRDLAFYARNALTAGTIDLALELQARSGGSSYGDVVAALERHRIDVAYVTFNASRDLGLLLRELTKSDLKLTVLSGDIGAAVGRWTSGEVRNIPLLFTYCRELSLPERDGMGAADVDLRNQLRRVHAAVEIWAEAVRIAGSLQGGQVAKVLHERKFASAIGDVRFDGKGDIQGPAAEWRWFRPLDGKMVPYAEH